LGARIVKKSWRVDPLFFEVQKRSGYSDDQMHHTFNMGIGMILVLRKTDVPGAQVLLERFGVNSWAIGIVKKGSGVVIE